MNLSQFPRDRNRPDGRSLYCRECSVRKVKEYRERKRAKKKAEIVFKAAIEIKRKPSIVASVQTAIAEGRTTREAIQRFTHLDYDTLGEILADLVWETKTVRIERTGKQRQFVAAA